MTHYTLVSAPAVNTAAVVTLPALASLKHEIDGINWSYAGGNPTNGNLVVRIGGVVELNLDITAQGADSIPLYRMSNDNESVVVTLAAGGGGVTGRVSIAKHRVTSGPKL